jgi:hypothetical protein
MMRIPRPATITPTGASTMKKLKLDLDELKADSFEISAPPSADGTVEGFRAWSDESVCPTTAPSRRICPI